METAGAIGGGGMESGIGMSVGALQRRRRQYAASARRREVPLHGLRFPASVVLPGGKRLVRHAHLFWRVRLPLWAVLSVAES